MQSKELLDFLHQRNIQLRTSPPHTHQRNGIVERAIQTMVNVARGLVQQAGLSESFWFLALQHAAYLRNRSPTSTFGGQCPLFMLNGSQPNIDKLRRFGCTVFVKTDESQRQSSHSHPNRDGASMWATTIALTAFVWCFWMTTMAR